MPCAIAARALYTFNVFWKNGGMYRSVRSVHQCMCCLSTQRTTHAAKHLETKKNKCSIMSCMFDAETFQRTHKSLGSNSAYLWNFKQQWFSVCGQKNVFFFNEWKKQLILQFNICEIYDVRHLHVKLCVLNINLAVG